MEIQPTTTQATATSQYASQMTAQQESGRLGSAVEAARRVRDGLVIVALKVGRLAAEQVLLRMPAANALRAEKVIAEAARVRACKKEQGTPSTWTTTSGPVTGPRPRARRRPPRF